MFIKIDQTISFVIISIFYLKTIPSQFQNRALVIQIRKYTLELILFQEKFLPFFQFTKVFHTYSKRFVTQKKIPSNQACGLLSDGSVPRKWKFSIESEDKTPLYVFSSHFEIHFFVSTNTFTSPLTTFTLFPSLENFS